MLKYMYLIKSSFLVKGKYTTSSTYVGGNDPQDARKRHLVQLTNLHGPIEGFVVTELTEAGSFDSIISEFLKEVK